VGLTPSPDASKFRKICCSYRESKHDSSVLQPVASDCTDRSLFWLHGFVCKFTELNTVGI